MALDYERFERILTRCEELGNDPTADRSIRRVFQDLLAAPAKVFLDAHAALEKAEAVAKKEGAEAVAALETIDPLYLKARAVADAYVKDSPIPRTLKSLRTDTDRKNALVEMLELLDEHDGDDEAGEGGGDDAGNWAKDLMTSEPGEPPSFGELAPQVIQELVEWIAANLVVDEAEDARAKAYGPAYEAYLKFKNVVRNTYGKSSLRYRRIHVRKSGKLAVEDPNDVVVPVTDPNAPANET